MTSNAWPEAVRALAGLIRSGVPIRRALEGWPDLVAELRPRLSKVSRRVALGASIEASFAAGDRDDVDLGPLAALLSIHAMTGGDAAVMLESFAAGIEERIARSNEARSATAGATLSGKVIAGLPLAMVPLTPAARAPLLDPLGATILVSGLALAATGLWWLSRLVPRPQIEEDPAVVVAGLARAALAGGASLPTVLTALSEHGPPSVEEALRVARRRVRLGESWARALANSEAGPLRSVARPLRIADDLGMPVADALDAFVAERKRSEADRFESAAKRAPVRMIFPLALCVLPSYTLLAFAPFVRASI